MPKQPMNAKVDEFLGVTKWKAEATKLRKLLLGAGLVEEWKWAKPCYTFEGKNVAVLVSMKESIALLFMKGFALADPHGVLEKQGPNTEVGRWIKFTSAKDVAAHAAIVSEYLQAAIEAEKAAVPRKPAKAASVALPEELKAAFAGSPELKAAFAALTPGRQKAYGMFFAGAKQAVTRAARVEKYRGRILAGRGMMDRAS